MESIKIQKQKNKDIKDKMKEIEKLKKINKKIEQDNMILNLNFNELENKRVIEIEEMKKNKSFNKSSGELWNNTLKKEDAFWKREIKKKFIKIGDVLKIQKENGELLKANGELSKQNKEIKKKVQEYENKLNEKEDSEKKLKERIRQLEEELQKAKKVKKEYQKDKLDEDSSNN